MKKSSYISLRERWSGGQCQNSDNRHSVFGCINQTDSAGNICLARPIPESNKTLPTPGALAEKGNAEVEKTGLKSWLAKLTYGNRILGKNATLHN